MNSPPPLPPQFPPRVPAEALPYGPAYHPGRYVPYAPYAKPRPNFGQQAAKASWVAPLIVAVIGISTLSMRAQDRTMALCIGISNTVLIIIGFTLGIVALFAIRKHGHRGVLTPALVGVLVNGSMLVGCVMLFILAARLSAGGGGLLPASPAARAAALQAAEQEGRDSAMNYDGWMGFARKDGAVITVTAIHDDSPFAQFMRLHLGRDCSIAVVAVDASSASSNILLNTSDVRLRFADREVAALPTRDVLNGVTVDRERALAEFGPPFPVEARTVLEGKPIFLPRGLDLTTLEGVVVGADGRPFEVPGRHYSVAEKAELLRKAEGQKGVAAVGE